MDFLGVKKADLSNLKRSHPVDKILAKALDRSDVQEDIRVEHHEHHHDHGGYEHWRESPPGKP